MSNACGALILRVRQNKFMDKIIYVLLPILLSSVTYGDDFSFAFEGDQEGKTIKEYEVNGYPDYYIIDRDGALVVADCSNSKV